MRYLLLIAFACGQPSAPVESAPASSEQDEQASATPAPTPVPEPVGDPPVVAMALEPDGAGVQLRLESRGQEPAHLSSDVLLQRKDGAEWRDVGGVKLRSSCDEAPAPCLTLVPGATFMPPAWTGRTGNAQCECGDCEPAPPGDYRFVVQSCPPEDGVPHKVSGEPFAWPSP